MGKLRPKISNRHTVTEQLRRILESKRNERTRLAALPFAEKLRLLEKLRARTLTIAASRK